MGVVDHLSEGLVGIGHADVAELGLDGDVAVEGAGNVVPRIAVGNLCAAGIGVVVAGGVADGGVRGLDDLLGERGVLLERQRGGIDHDAREAGADGGHDVGEARTMVEMDDHGHGGGLGALDHGGNRVGADVLQLVGVDLDDDGRILALGDVHDSVEHGIGADIEGGDRETVLVSHGKKLVHIDQHADLPS